jgi:hypothetical protein
MDIKATTLDELIPLLVTRISTFTGITPDYIVPTLAERHFEPGGYSDKFVLISGFSGTDYEGETTGAGLAAKWWNAVLDVVMLCRVDLDTPGRDTQRLTSATYGLLPKWRTLLKGLDQWYPDDGGTPALGLLIQPARTLGFSISERETTSTNGWVQIRTKLHMPFWQDLN